MTETQLRRLEPSKDDLHAERALREMDRLRESMVERETLFGGCYPLSLDFYPLLSAIDEGRSIKIHTGCLAGFEDVRDDPSESRGSLLILTHKPGYHQRKFFQVGLG